MIPFSFFGKSMLSSLGLPLMAIALIVLGSFGFYFMATMKSAGKTEAEFERLATVTQRYAQKEQRNKTLVKHSLERAKETEETAIKIHLRAQERKQKIEQMPKSDPVICPIDCILPEIP